MGGQTGKGGQARTSRCARTWSGEGVRVYRGAGVKQVLAEGTCKGGSGEEGPGRNDLRFAGACGRTRWAWGRIRGG